MDVVVRGPKLNIYQHVGTASQGAKQNPCSKILRQLSQPTSVPHPIRDWGSVKKWALRTGRRESESESESETETETERARYREREETQVLTPMFYTGVQSVLSCMWIHRPTEQADPGRAVRSTTHTVCSNGSMCYRVSCGLRPRACGCARDGLRWSGSETQRQ